MGLIPGGRELTEARFQAEYELGQQPNPRRYIFPGLTDYQGLGLEQLLAHTLRWFSRTYLNGPTGGIPIDRLIFTAHRGGGVALNELLRFHNVRRACDPHEIHVHDFKDEQLGHIHPYGVYDLQNNEGWVNVGINHDTAEFAVQSIRTWWQQMGQARFPNASSLLITADGGGSNGYRVRLWKVELQKLADELLDGM